MRQPGPPSEQRISGATRQDGRPLNAMRTSYRDHLIEFEPINQRVKVSAITGILKGTSIIPPTGTYPDKEAAEWAGKTAVDVQLAARNCPYVRRWRSTCSPKTRRDE
jgi:hypothetical protein